jgi:hypothetical protein
MIVDFRKNLVACLESFQCQLVRNQEKLEYSYRKYFPHGKNNLNNTKRY